LGNLNQDEVFEIMKKAMILVFPSLWYETFGKVIIEAFACGTPVLSSRLGAMAEIIEDGRTGLHFTPGNSDDLALKIDWIWNHPKEMHEMSYEARQEYEKIYTPEKNYQILQQIYNNII